MRKILVLVVDARSNVSEIFIFPSKNTEKNSCNYSLNARYGYPISLVSDKFQQFTSAILEKFEILWYNTYVECSIPPSYKCTSWEICANF